MINIRPTEFHLKLHKITSGISNNHFKIHYIVKYTTIKL